MNMRRVALLAQKEARHILRDWRTLYMAFGIPLLLLILFGYALTMDIDRIPLVVVDQDHSTESRDLAGSFERASYFTIVDRSDSADGILHAFRTNQAKAALAIPVRFARMLGRGEAAEVQLIVDGTDANVASITIGYASAIAQMQTIHLAVNALNQQGLAGGVRLKPPITVQSRNWFNTTLKSQWYLVPGLVALIMAMMSAILMSLTVAREWENGTMEQLLATPVTPPEILLGKLIPYFGIGLGQLTLIAAAGVVLFDVPIRGNLGSLYLMSAIFLVGSLAQGLLISIVMRQQQLAMQFALLTTMLPALLLSGFMAPIASMPKLIQVISYIVPARYFLVIVRGLFLKGISLSAVWPQALALIVFATLMLTLGVRKFKTRIE